MAPDAMWLQWLVVIAGLVQAVAAVAQIYQGRKREGGWWRRILVIDAVTRRAGLTVLLGVARIWLDAKLQADEATILYERQILAVLTLALLAGAVWAIWTGVTHDTPHEARAVHFWSVLAAGFVGGYGLDVLF